jgi:hypothetical protein
LAKNVIKNCEEIIEYFEINHEWHDWFTLGKMTSSNGIGGTWDHFPNEKEFKEQVLNRDENYRYKVDKIIYEISKNYFEYYNINYNNYRYDNWGISMYNPNSGVSETLGMNYHTDFIQHLSENPGWKFGTSIVIYPNDDYEGGEISFKIFKDNNYEEIDKEFNYKPKKGDVLIFPSVYPYLHGVKNVSSGHKYICRLYWQFEFSGSDNWKLLNKKYADDLKNLEKERINYVLKGGGSKEINGSFVPTETFSEYYKRLNFLD